MFRVKNKLPEMPFYLLVRSPSLPVSSEVPQQRVEPLGVLNGAGVSPRHLHEATVEKLRQYRTHLLALEYVATSHNLSLIHI